MLWTVTTYFVALVCGCFGFAFLVWNWVLRHENSASRASLLQCGPDRYPEAAVESAGIGANGAREAVFVFAHPDDEAMFFTPTLRDFAKHKVRFHFLCFSTGNYAGLGEVRSRELHQSGAVYGAASVTIVDDRRCQDGPAKWDTGFVAAHLQAYLNERPAIQMVFTFDAGGVSGHTNHLDTYAATRKLALSSTASNTVFYQLRTTPLLVKYSGPAELLVWAASRALGRGAVGSSSGALRFVVPRDELAFSLKGMQAHASQLVWFRYLFVAFSQYGFINEWAKMK